jgi:hypothetical protein
MKITGRKDVIEAVVIAVLVAAGTKAVDLIVERLTKKKRAKPAQKGGRR